MSSLFTELLEIECPKVFTEGDYKKCHMKHRDKIPRVSLNFERTIRFPAGERLDAKQVYDCSPWNV
jgi:hypothetical protein